MNLLRSAYHLIFDQRLESVNDRIRKTYPTNSELGDLQHGGGNLYPARCKSPEALLPQYAKDHQDNACCTRQCLNYDRDCLPIMGNLWRGVVSFSINKR
jgi:hypothetical protein